MADVDVRRQLRVAYNSVFRRISNYRNWQSVRELQSCLSRPKRGKLVESRVENLTHRVRISS